MTQNRRKINIFFFSFFSLCVILVVYLSHVITWDFSSGVRTKQFCFCSPKNSCLGRGLKAPQTEEPQKEKWCASVVAPVLKLQVFFSQKGFPAVKASRSLPQTVFEKSKLARVGGAMHTIHTGIDHTYSHEWLCTSMTKINTLVRWLVWRKLKIIPV